MYRSDDDIFRGDQVVMIGAHVGRRIPRIKIKITFAFLPPDLSQT
jgi:hypothetical protein